jgi:RNA polymerase sigma-70 factor, ECF subfamily
MTQTVHETGPRTPAIEMLPGRKGTHHIHQDRTALSELLAVEAVPSDHCLNPSTPPDAEAREAELVLAAQEGSKEAFEELRKLHCKRLYATVISMTRSREDTEDVLQDTFFRAYVALKTFEGRSKFGSWLTRIAINSALMTMRKRRRRSEVLVDQLGKSEDEPFALDIRDSRLNPEQLYDQRQRCSRMLRALKTLDPKLQAPIQMRTFNECTIKEVALNLGVSLATAKTRLHRGRRRLRKSLASADARTG